MLENMEAIMKTPEAIAGASAAVPWWCQRNALWGRADEADRHLQHRYKRRSASLVAFAALVPIAGAPSFAADQERHVVVSGTDLSGPPLECLRWPYPAYCRIAGVRQQIEDMRGGSSEGMCWWWLNAKACAHMDAAGTSPTQTR